MTRTRLFVPVLTVAVLLALTACDPQGDAEPSPSPTSASPTATTEASPTPTNAAPNTVTSPPCERDSLTNEFEFTDGTAGQQHGVLSVGNRTDAACSLSGYPTVYVGEPEAEGAMGAASTADPADPGVPLDLQPGDSAVAAITITQAGNVDGCTIVDTDYLIYLVPGVTFDGETNAQHVFTPPFPGCRNDDITLITVGGFAAG